MGSAGLVTILLTLKAGRLRELPRVLSRGVFNPSDRARVEHKTAEQVRNKLKGKRFSTSEEAEEVAIEAARRFLVHNHRKRPLVTADANGEP